MPRFIAEGIETISPVIIRELYVLNNALQSYTKSYQLRFNGIDQYGDAGVNPLLHLQTISIECWVKPTVSLLNTPGYYAMMEYDTTDSQGLGRGWHLGISSPSGLAFFTKGSADGTFEGTASSTILQPDTWYHIVGTYLNNGNIKIYINGILESEAIPDTSGINYINATGFTIALMRLGVNPDVYAPLVIDEARIYNKELTLTEIQRHYNGGLGEYGLAEDNLVVGYHFDGGAGNIVYDYSGNEINLSLINEPIWENEEKAKRDLINSTVSDIIIEDGTKGIIVKDAQSIPHYWRITIVNNGALLTTDLGTSLS